MGCAMGTICAPSYANNFIGNFEEKHIYPYIKEKSQLYLRYIDDILMIWKSTKAELMMFMKKLNAKHKTIKFDLQISPRKIVFLNTVVTSKQLYIGNLQINNHSYTLNQNIQDF